MLNDNKHSLVCWTYPLLKDEIPCSSTQSVTDEELEDIQRKVEDNVVKPDDTSPAPSNALDRSKCPVGIYSNQRSDLETTQCEQDETQKKEGKMAVRHETEFREFQVAHQLCNQESKN